MVATPGTTDEGTTKEDNEDKLDEYHSNKYRAIVSRVNCLTSDRSGTAFSVNEFARSMSCPGNGWQKKLERLGRYLITKPRAVIDFKCHAAQHKHKVFTDAD